VTLLASPIPLDQCMGLEMDEPSRGDVSPIEDDSLGWLKELTLVQPYLEEAPFEFCDDVVMSRAAPSIGHIDSICTKLLDSMPVLSPLLPATPSHIRAFHESLGDIRGCHPSFDPYCEYLEDELRNTWSTFFDHALDFLWRLMSLRGH